MRVILDESGYLPEQIHVVSDEDTLWVIASLQAISLGAITGTLLYARHDIAAMVVRVATAWVA